MTSVYLVRHGQTAWNKEEIFRGRSDVPLNPMGFREAELVGEFLRGKDIDMIYSSPLSRAKETAGRIAQVFDLKVQILEGINDMSFGKWEGRPLKEVQSNDRVNFLQWRDQPHLARIPEGETLGEVRIRAMAALGEVIQNHQGKNIVLVSHRVVNKVILCGILGINNSHFWQMGQGTAAINLIQFREGKYVLSLLNEGCHLKSLKDQTVRVDF